MLNKFSRTWFVAIWLTILVVLTAGTMAVDAQLSTSALVLVLGVAPGIVALLIRGHPSPTIAEILHSVNTRQSNR
jgi:hypothetical protein